MYDAALTQYVSWHESNEYGGINKTLHDMLSADNSFVLGHCLKNGLDLIGTSIGPSNHPHLKNNLQQLNEIVNNELSTSITSLSRREQLHVKAINQLFKGNLSQACDLWETILIENPTDLMAIKFAHDTYFYLGDQSQLRDSVARVLPFWKPEIPL